MKPRDIAVFIALVIPFSSSAFGTVTSALINKQLDTQQNFKFDATLPEVIQQIGNQTGVRIEADPAVWELLPWGEQTTITAMIQNRTLRQGLEAITEKLALEFVLADEAVELRPMPALRRLGRRATVDELGVLGLMSTTFATTSNDASTVRQLVSTVDQKLAALKSPFAIDDRAAGIVLDQKISVARNATLADVLDDISQQTDATWYPWGKSIVIVSKEEQIRSQLSKTISARYTNVDVSQVVLELMQRAGVDFTADPGVYQKVQPQFRSIQLLLDNATVQQGLESVAGYTGLSFDVTDKGMHVSFQSGK